MAQYEEDFFPEVDRSHGCGMRCIALAIHKASHDRGFRLILEELEQDIVTEECSEILWGWFREYYPTIPDCRCCDGVGCEDGVNGMPLRQAYMDY